MQKISIATGAALWLGAPLALAQEPARQAPTQLREISVTATRTERAADGRDAHRVRLRARRGAWPLAGAERDIRGFTVKFYTEEGNWDMVGNNTPVFC